MDIIGTFYILGISLVIITYIGLKHLFSDGLNSLFYFGPLYVITRDNSNIKDPHLSLGFMRQTSHPWKIGKGLNIRFNRYSIQIGLCRKSGHKDEESGLLGAMGGRLLDEDVSEIRKW